jgi:hypothetical protein
MANIVTDKLDVPGGVLFSYTTCPKILWTEPDDYTPTLVIFLATGTDDKFSFKIRT